MEQNQTRNLNDSEKNSQAQKRVKMAEAAIRVPCTPDIFVRKWFEYLTPVHKLTDREIDVASALVDKYIQLKEIVKDDKMLNSLLFSKETKSEICQKLNITPVYFNRIIYRLKQTKIIKDKTLNQLYIPNYTPGKPFRLMIIIDDAATVRKNTE